MTFNTYNSGAQPYPPKELNRLFFRHRDQFPDHVASMWFDRSYASKLELYRKYVEGEDA